MSQSSDPQNVVQLIWQIADELLRDFFRQSDIQGIVFSFLMLQRLDCLYTDEIRERVCSTYQQLKDEVSDDELELILLGQSEKLSFYNLSDLNLKRLEQNPQAIESNFDFYIKSYSKNVRNALQSFNLEELVAKLVRHNLLKRLIERVTEINLNPSAVSNLEMGVVYESLLGRFNQFSGETAGQHYTPREVIRLMCNLLFVGYSDDLRGKGIVREIFDPACGSGGMLTAAKNYILEAVNPDAEIRLYGQEINQQTYALAKSISLMTDGDSFNIQQGNSFTQDQFQTKNFHYMLSNPPFGVNWKSEENFIKTEAKNPHGRFYAGTPRVNDGTLLFLQHMMSKMDPEGSRIAIVLHGSPMHVGEAGSGESNIRRWIVENDYLEAIVALPDRMFYNTAISTYIWILTNRKSPHRRGKVQLVNGVNRFQKVNKPLGCKRNELLPEHIEELTELYKKYQECEEVKIFSNDDFGYSKIIIERPLRLNFQVSENRLKQLQEDPVWVTLGTNKSNSKGKIRDRNQDLNKYIFILRKLDETKLYKNRNLFLADLQKAAAAENTKIPSQVLSLILNRLSERDETADVCTDVDGHPEPDPKLRSYEEVSLKRNISEYMRQEVLPHALDAWVDENKKKIGYEIPYRRTTESLLGMLQRQNIRAWNKWRQEDPYEKELNLRGVSLNQLCLQKINLRRADLSFAKLSEVDLSNADLRESNLSSANLSKSNLSGANLNGANLSGANLSGANLSGANLNESNLSNADLSEARLDFAWLCSTSLKGSNLTNTNLVDAELIAADFNQANISNANFRFSRLNKANLRGANLSSTNFSSATLRDANISRTQALATDFNNAILTGACVEDWNINSSTNLDGVQCEFIYEGYDANTNSYTRRRPIDPNSSYAPNEFTQRFQIIGIALETIDLTFSDGIDWKAFFQAFQELTQQYSGEDISIQAIERKGTAFIVRLEVDSQADKASIESNIKELYEAKIVALEGKYQERLQLSGEKLDFYRQELEIKRKENADLHRIVEIQAKVQEAMAENQGSKYDMRGSNFGNFVDTAQPGSRQQSVQHNYAAPEKQSLADAAQEIQRLLKQLEQTNPSATEMEKRTFVTAAVPASLRKRAVSALKAGGKTALEELLDNSYVNIGMAIIEGWQEAED